MYSFEMMTHAMHKITQTYAFATTETIGTSCLGKPIYALCIGYGATAIGYNAAHHANEWLTTPLLMQFVEAYCRFCEENTDYLQRFTLYAIPMVNPDGVEAVQNGTRPPHWKANARGVDLNSNYPASWETARQNKHAQGYTQAGAIGYVGERPLCEPESSAMVAYTQLRDFALTLSLHTQGEEIYWRYRHFDPPRAQELAANMQNASTYLCVDVPDEASHGGYRDWFIEAFNRPGFTIECGLGVNPLPYEDFDAIYEKVKGILWAGVDVKD
ncbi:MAG: M14 family metallocarboxypeptidase [Defluviitaleaceae bacterium]|nr:M14 family metallocarboxypeptidase [Defluviitaleaceae bacterium]MCL2274334.1 M14 family metallocarboxypeptidase [Defluviitaleaceae bacterium]